eukprot:6891453-Pyramimonas_sp.AAC.1
MNVTRVVSVMDTIGYHSRGVPQDTQLLSVGSTLLGNKVSFKWTVTVPYRDIPAQSQSWYRTVTVPYSNSTVQ